MIVNNRQTSTESFSLVLQFQRTDLLQSFPNKQLAKWPYNHAWFLSPFATATIEKFTSQEIKRKQDPRRNFTLEKINSGLMPLTQLEKPQGNIFVLSQQIV